MEPESPSLYPQVPVTCPYPEPTPSSTHDPPPTSWRSILILSSHLRLGHKIVNFATSKNLDVKSTMFPHRNIHKYTWTSPDGQTHNQIDHNINIIDLYPTRLGIQNLAHGS
jgi:hypothetical protein